MANLTWVGGGNNQASNPNDWSPQQAPQPGDLLEVQNSSGGFPFFTMNVSGGNLAGDPVYVFTSDLTVNMSHKAVVTARMVTDSVGTFNLSQNSTLDLSTATGALVGTNPAFVNVFGNDNLILSSEDSLITINLQPDAKLNGTFTLGPFHGQVFGGITINGGAGAVFNNDGLSLIENSEQATVSTDVIGKGSFNVVNKSFGPIASLVFGASVGPQQSITDSGLVVIDRPNEFSAHVTLTSIANPDPKSYDSPADIDLMSLATADGYSYKNDMLNILSGSKIIDTLRLHDSTPNGFVVEPPTAAGSVNIVAITDPLHPPPSLPNLTGVV